MYLLKIDTAKLNPLIMNTKTYWLLTVIFAFASVISFFQINSYYADLHHCSP